MEVNRPAYSTFFKGMAMVIQMLCCVLMSAGAVTFKIYLDKLDLIKSQGEEADGIINAIKEANPFTSPGFLVLLAGIIIWLVCLGYLTKVCGRDRYKKPIPLHTVDRMPLEFPCAICAAAIIILAALENHLKNYIYETSDKIIATAVLTVLADIIIVITYLSIVRRWKKRMLIDSSVIAGLFKNGAGNSSAAGTFTRSYEEKSLADEVKKIAGGDIDYKIDTAKYHGDLKILADSINNIGDGLKAAVNQQIQDERMKAAMITNISHDLKTPLTSIINYAGLLKMEDIDNPKAEAYIDVLEQKSYHLKELLEDFLEISRISSGSIKLTMTQIDFVMLVRQTAGEFNEKLEERGLKAVYKLPHEPAIVMADGRQLWRVIGNLYGNVAKYAEENSTIYVDVTTTGAWTRFSMKNVCQNAINVPTDSLTERFVMGDSSRKSEGSGLGLSISKMLTEQMEGKFEIIVEDNIFTANVYLPRQLKNM